LIIKQLNQNLFLNDEVVSQNSDEYMYMACIQFIKQMKTGPFGEHSRILYDIAHVPHQLWTKVNNGLLKMYKDEVLEKFPVIQHFVFGSILKLE